MSERTTEEIRGEIAAERSGLHEDLNALKAEVRLPLVLAGTLVGGALLAVALLIGIKRIRRRR